MKLILSTGKLTALLLSLLSTLPVFAQPADFIDGAVITEDGGQPIPNCSVYFNSTSNGDVTRADGGFRLTHAPIGKYELVISAIGYETVVLPVSSDKYPYHLKIKLKTKVSDLSAVTVSPFLQDGWEKYGDIFLKSFIGTTPNSANCKITNHQILKFWFSEKTNRLTARADEPLIIENKALGYTVKYKLDQFTIDFNNNTSVYIGYPFFEEETPANETERKRWLKNRREAYQGSVLDFMRNLYGDLWQEEGFRIVAKTKIPNLEKARVQKIHFEDNQKTDTFKTDAKGNIIPAKSATGRNDSTHYYKKILKQPDFYEAYVSLNDIDSLLTTNGDSSKSFYFHDRLKILYQPKPTDRLLQSEVFLVTPEPIIIQKNGSYYSPRELFVLDRWADYEKLANALPLDYVNTP